MRSLHRIDFGTKLSVDVLQARLHGSAMVISMLAEAIMDGCMAFMQFDQLPAHLRIVLLQSNNLIGFSRIMRRFQRLNLCTELRIDVLQPRFHGGAVLVCLPAKVIVDCGVDHVQPVEFRVHLRVVLLQLLNLTKLRRVVRCTDLGARGRDSVYGWGQVR